jgi:hypothetical protein
LFDELRIQQVEFTVQVSFPEIYNEELLDLSPTDDSSKLRIFGVAANGSVIINGLEEVTVHNKNEVYAILERGSFKRQDHRHLDECSGQLLTYNLLNHCTHKKRTWWMVRSS